MAVFKFTLEYSLCHSTEKSLCLRRRGIGSPAQFCKACPCNPESKQMTPSAKSYSVFSYHYRVKGLNYRQLHLQASGQAGSESVTQHDTELASRLAMAGAALLATAQTSKVSNVGGKPAPPKPPRDKGGTTVSPPQINQQLLRMSSLWMGNPVRE